MVDCDTGDIDVGGPSKASGGSTSGRKGNDKGGGNASSARANGRALGSEGKVSGGDAGGDDVNGNFSNRGGVSKAGGDGVGGAFERGDTFGGLVLRFPSSIDRWLLKRLREIRKMSRTTTTTTNSNNTTTTAAAATTATTVTTTTTAATTTTTTTTTTNPGVPPDITNDPPCGSPPNLNLDPGKDTAIQLVIFDALLNLLRFVPGCLFTLHGDNEIFNRPLFLSECCRTMEEREFMTGEHSHLPLPLSLPSHPPLTPPNGPISMLLILSVITIPAHQSIHNPLSFTHVMLNTDLIAFLSLTVTDSVTVSVYCLLSLCTAVLTETNAFQQLTATVR